MALYDDQDGAFARCDFETRAEMEAGIQIGARVLVFDSNRRIYRRTDKHTSSGGPISRGHFRGASVVGETSRSWILDHVRGGPKIPKKTLKGVYSNHCADRHSWWVDNRYRIVETIRRDLDFTTGVELYHRFDLADRGIPAPPVEPSSDVRERFGDVANGRD